MPAIASSAYQTVEAVLNRIRNILNDSEVQGGDVFTDTSPFAIDFVNNGYEHVQSVLSSNGVETYMAEWWLIAVPAMPIVDPEGRLYIDDTGTTIQYPNSPLNNSFSLTPQLPTDLICPTDLFERQTNSTTPVGPPMRNRNNGLLGRQQSTFLKDWQWLSDRIQLIGALQIQDLKIAGEKALPKVASPNDIVPIRGVLNAAAYYSALAFTESRGGVIAPSWKARADEEVFSMVQSSSRRKQHKQVRRRPFSDRGGRHRFPF